MIECASMPVSDNHPCTMAHQGLNQCVVCAKCDVGSMLIVIRSVPCTCGLLDMLHSEMMTYE